MISSNNAKIVGKTVLAICKTDNIVFVDQLVTKPFSHDIGDIQSENFEIKRPKC